MYKIPSFCNKPQRVNMYIACDRQCQAPKVLEFLACLELKFKRGFFKKQRYTGKQK
jgi:hypothetical protein